MGGREWNEEKTWGAFVDDGMLQGTIKVMARGRMRQEWWRMRMKLKEMTVMMMVTVTMMTGLAQVCKNSSGNSGSNKKVKNDIENMFKEKYWRQTMRCTYFVKNGWDEFFFGFYYIPGERCQKARDKIPKEWEIEFFDKSKRKVRAGFTNLIRWNGICHKTGRDRKLVFLETRSSFRRETK